MSEVSVNFGAMQTGVSDIQARYSAIQAKLDDLKAFLEPMRATWTGAARDSYDAKQREWDQSASDLQAILNSMMSSATLRMRSPLRMGTLGRGMSTPLALASPTRLRYT
jgi:WXG100 family type VII secretion target